MADEERVELKLDIHYQTDLAYKVSDGDKVVWLPKSLVGYDGEVFYIPESLALEKGLV